MTTFKRNILITGGAGFIGSHVVRLFVNKYPEYRIINLDKLTYAGNLANLKDIENLPNYVFIKADICDYEKMRKHSVNHVFSSPTSIINFTSKKPSYDDTRRSGRDNELLQRAQNDL